ncbi:Aspartate carbamoyltransferase [Candidatus Burarchaeum australiense]|nr:Aspartate carbamoyltransferase [Candidatus Burarchaeum australiense]
MKDLVSIRDVEKRWATSIFKLADELDSKPAPRKLAGKVLSTLFFEPSTRTRLSFHTAAARLGISLLDIESVGDSSIVKGESLVDTIKIVDGYADCIVIRHPLEGSARLAADLAQHPVINAGDGGNQHPTQTLIDLYTMNRLKKKISGLHVSLVGDLKYARTMHSLLYGLAMFGAEITLVSPKELQMEKAILEEVKEKFGTKVRISNEMNFRDCDVLYVCRIQKERFADPYEAVRLQQEFRITLESLKGAKDDLIILHPLPKVDEIAPEVDRSEKVRYFEQARYGVPVRMAILSDVMG